MRAAIRFRALRTKLAILYGGLFAVAMACVSIALFTVVERNAVAQVRNELLADGTVFDRLWAQRAEQMQSAAGLLARDFGFRAAVATGDHRTAATAVDNLRQRLQVTMAFVVGEDGIVTGVADGRERTDAAALWRPLDAGQMRGVAIVDGRARQLVAAPIMAPALSGWIVFAADLDRAEMRQLERLSAIPLSAGVYQRDGHGGWRPVDGKADSVTSEFIDHALKSKEPAQLSSPQGTAIALAKPLQTMDGAPDAVLLLRYPLALAMAPYRALRLAFALIAAFGLAGVVYMTWRMTASITRPISRLDEAAGRLAAGESITVAVRSEDELGRLAASFNHMAHEIAEREQRITHLAFNDPLTGLPNRALFHEHFEHQLRILDRRHGDTGLALFCLDLDDFKSINDTLGHPVGAALLKVVADRLATVADDCFVARLGGDEFVIVHPIGEGRVSADHIARGVLSAVEAPVSIEGHEIVPGVSLGIAIAPQDGMNSETLLRNADLALYRAKEAGRRTWCFFEEDLNARAQMRRAMEGDLRRALANGEFELHFQPLFDLAEDRIKGFEALLRWRHPTRGMVSPADFVPIAEDTGLIVPIGAWVMQEACRAAAHWPSHVRVAVNVSSVQIQRPGLEDVVLQALAASGLAPTRLELEITESIFLEGLESTLQMLHRLRAIGIRIALDDFGTGYSSLSYLQRFPFDKLKIDQSFIRDLATRPGAVAVVRAITDLARALGMETTAEGVEERGQLSTLRDQGCSSIQGYLFSRPVPAADVVALIEKHGGGAAQAA